MKVYQLKPKGRCCGGMALVAASTFEEAEKEYNANGSWGEYFSFGEYEYMSTSSHPILGLDWHGEKGIICDNMYFE